MGGYSTNHWLMIGFVVLFWTVVGVAVACVGIKFWKRLGR